MGLQLEEFKMFRATSEITSSHGISEFLREKKMALTSCRMRDSRGSRSVMHSLT